MYASKLAGQLKALLRSNAAHSLSVRATKEKEVLLNQLAIKAIRFYQQHISPRKGYCCAHNALHQNGSCSSWAISVIESQGALAMASEFGSRIAECAEANKELSEKKKENEEESQPCDKTCNTAEIGCCLLSSWPFN